MSVLSVEGGPQLGTVETIVTSGRGLNPEELTRLYLPKLVYVGPDLPPGMKEQAEAGRARIEALMLRGFAQAQKSEHTTIYNVLKNAGHDAAADLVKEL